MNRRNFVLSIFAVVPLCVAPAIAQARTPEEILKQMRDYIDAGKNWVSSVVFRFATDLEAAASSGGMTLNQLFEAYAIIVRIENSNSKLSQAATTALTNAKIAVIKASGMTEDEFKRRFEEAVKKSKDLADLMRPSPTVGEPGN